MNSADRKDMGDAIEATMTSMKETLALDTVLVIVSYVGEDGRTHTHANSWGNDYAVYGTAIWWMHDNGPEQRPAITEGDDDDGS